MNVDHFLGLSCGVFSPCGRVASCVFNLVIFSIGNPLFFAMLRIVVHSTFLPSCVSGRVNSLLMKYLNAAIFCSIGWLDR